MDVRYCQAFNDYFKKVVVLEYLAPETMLYIDLRITKGAESAYAEKIKGIGSLSG